MIQNLAIPIKIDKEALKLWSIKTYRVSPDGTLDYLKKSHLYIPKEPFGYLVASVTCEDTCRAGIRNEEKAITLKSLKLDRWNITHCELEALNIYKTNGKFYCKNKEKQVYYIVMFMENRRVLLKVHSFDPIKAFDESTEIL